MPISVRRRDECVAAYVPDHQWELLQQSLKEHNQVAVQADVPTDVVVEAGLLVRKHFQGSTTNHSTMNHSLNNMNSVFCTH